jgi:biotin carboxyl carrier protein
VIRGEHGEDRQVDVEADGDRFEVVIDGQPHIVEMIRLDGSFASLRFADNGRSFRITYQQRGNGSWRLGVAQREFDLDVLTPAQAAGVAAGEQQSGPSKVVAPIPGKVIAVKVALGDEVEPGQPLVVLEAMKMENELAADQAGRVTAVHVEAGSTVETGHVLVEIE